MSAGDGGCVLGCVTVVTIVTVFLIPTPAVILIVTTVTNRHTSFRARQMALPFRVRLIE